jgi:hypothetical protein
MGRNTKEVMKLFASEYGKQESSSKILFTGKKHVNLKEVYNMYKKYQYNDIKIKKLKKDIKICNSVDFLKQK